MNCSQHIISWENSQCTDKAFLADMQSQQYGDTMMLSGSICSAIYTNPIGGNFEKMLSVASLATCLILPAFADNHGSAPEGNGAFTALFVAAKDVERYIESVKSNPALFEMIGAEAAGYCETISGRDYVGQLMLWNAFPSVTRPLSAPQNTIQARHPLTWQANGNSSTELHGRP